MELSKKEQRERLLAMAKLLWQLVTTTPGVADLAEPMKRVERDFSRLSKGQQTTIAVIAKQLDEGFDAIDKEKEEKVEEKPEIVNPDAIISPSGEETES